MEGGGTGAREVRTGLGLNSGGGRSQEDDSEPFKVHLNFSDHCFLKSVYINIVSLKCFVYLNN